MDDEQPELPELTEDEITEFKEAFDLFDRDKDGAVTTSELDTILRSLGHTLVEVEVQALVDEVDIEGTGTMDFQDFLVIMARRKKDTDSEEELREAFRIFDKDGSGLLAAEEMKTIMATLGYKLSEEEVIEMFKEVDIDREGMINIEEFVMVLMK